MLSLYLNGFVILVKWLCNHIQLALHSTSMISINIDGEY
jgi:hypothetical protein